MDPFFAFIENSALSEWIRGSESIFAFPTIITFHAIGMAFLAGGSAAPGIDPPLRIKMIVGISLCMWVGVLICGRLITFFRPPFFH